MCRTDRYPIAVFEGATFDWHIVHERTVETVEISEYELVAMSLDLGMLSRDCTFRYVNGCSTLSANDCRRIGKWKHGTLEFSGDDDETRVHGCARTFLSSEKFTRLGCGEQTLPKISGRVYLKG